MFSCRVDLSQVIRNLELTPLAVEELVVLGAVEHAHTVMEASKAQVPRGTGTLAESGYVGSPIVSPGMVVVPMGYGGPNDQVNPVSGLAASTYAVPVHERVEVPHGQGKAKFLEDPLHEFAPHLLESLGKYIRTLL